MNIFGESFPKEIIEQIKQRQNHYGSNTRSPDEISYLNAKTGWCKLVSSVDITRRTNEDGIVTDPENSVDERLKLIGVPLEYSGNKLAKEFVLFNGTSIQNKQGTTQRAGISTDKSIVNDNVYGLGGLEFGLSPMPGIISTEIKTLNRGSIKESTVQIKAFNRTQFQIIETLYLRLGYPVLLEWGHSMYYDNTGVFHKGLDQDWSIANDFLDSKLDNYFKILNKIQKNRLDSNGNYDALLGKVKNFNWTFNTDGSFSITLYIISVGDVIESLQMNSLLPNVAGNNGLQIPVYSSNENKHSIGDILNSCKLLLDDNNQSVNVGENKYYSFPNTISNFHTGKKDIVKINWKGHDPTYYYRFGSFLKVIEKLLLIYKKENEPVIKIDYDDANYVYLSPWMISTDPGKCIVRNEISQLNPSITLFDICEKYDFGINKARVGILMNVYINFDYILDAIDSNITEEGKISLITFLDKICEGINYSLGNKNRISPSIDEVTNRIVFIDETPIPNYNEVISYLDGLPEYKDKIQGSTTEIAEFDLYGYRYTSGSTAGFVKDFNLSTTISPNLATIITVGATANGKIVGEDATAFSKWNVALKNRVTETLIDSSKFKNTQPQTTPPRIEDIYTKAIDAYTEFAIELSEYKWDQNNIDTFPNTLRNLLDAQTSYISSKTSDNVGTLSTGFLPLNLSLTMEGLSGMKVYQQLKVDTTFLPSNYPTIFKFLIKAIVHKIENNIWTTQLETMSASTSTLKLEPILLSNRTNNRETTPTTDFLGKQRGSTQTTQGETNDFLLDTLKGLGINNPNVYQLQLMQIWRQHEGGQAAWNPFNTTLNTFGSTQYNFVPVRNYPNRASGLQATIQTLKNGRYSNIITAIKNIKTQTDINKAIEAINTSPWGSKILPANYTAWKTFNNLLWKEPLVNRA